MITIPCLCSREDVKVELDLKATIRSDAKVDRAIEAATGSIEGALNRRFFPVDDTRYFPFPDPVGSRPWVLWLNQHELVAVTALAAGGVTISEADYFLEPNGEPPYNRIEINLGTSAAFSAGATTQRAVTVSGTFAGAPIVTTAAGALAADVDDSTTTVPVTDSSLVGVGDLLLTGQERMLVIDKSMRTTGQTLQAPIGATKAEDTLAVSSGAAVHEGEVILLGSERMLITDIAGNSVIVKRAWDGTTLASHTGSTIYALRSLTVQRGANGTTAASQSSGQTVTRYVVPGLLQHLAVAEATASLVQGAAGWMRTGGSDKAEREMLTAGIGVLREQAYVAHGRQARTRAV